ncbi:MAG: hypothetical protein IJ312_05270 [Treponema sp.]|nr:hypothetical protein [Treponema sp.]
MKYKYQILNLQFFSKSSLNEKKYSQKDMDDAIKKRLAREKRKWQRDLQINRAHLYDDLEEIVKEAIDELKAKRRL